MNESQNIKIKNRHHLSSILLIAVILRLKSCMVHNTTKTNISRQSGRSHSDLELLSSATELGQKVVNHKNWTVIG